jgi:hypothetical protein
MPQAMVLDDTLLDDAARLAAADSAGLLRAAAMAGAQIRAVGEQARELDLDERLDIGRPRALVLVVPPNVGRRAAQVLAALLGPACPVPVVVSEVVPSWVGALDVVLVHTDDPGDTELAGSLERAARYGATVVVSAPPDGPVASAVAGRGLLLAPRVPVPAGFAFPRALATGLVTAGALGLLRADLDALAGHLDAEAEQAGPGHEPFVNPAKGLALRLSEVTPLLWGLDPVATAVAAHGAHVFAAHAAVVCDAADFRVALARPALHRAVLGGALERDIFADPDDPVQVRPLRVVLLAVRAGPAVDATRYRAEETVPGADVLVAGEGDDTDDVSRAAVLALRLEMASIYLGLAAGVSGQSGPG